MTFLLKVIIPSESSTSPRLMLIEIEGLSSVKCSGFMEKKYYDIDLK